MVRRYWMYRYSPEYWEAALPYSVAAVLVHIALNWLMSRVNTYKNEHPYLSADMRTFWDLVYIGIWLFYIVIEVAIIWMFIRDVWYGGT